MTLKSNRSPRFSSASENNSSLYQAEVFHGVNEHVFTPHLVILLLRRQTLRLALE